MMSISGIGSGSQFVRSFQPPSFSSIDSNSSGAISLDELKAGAPGGASSSKGAERAEQMFKAMDADADGSVTSSEKDAFDAKLQEQRQSMQFMTQLMAGGMRPPSNDDVFAATDKDGSGGVSLEEFSASEASESMSSDDVSALFSVIDEDADGAISKSESSDFLDTLKGAMDSGPMRGPPPGGPPPGGGPGGAEASSSTDEEDEEDEDTAAIDLLSIAAGAYSSASQSDDLLATLAKILDEAA